MKTAIIIVATLTIELALSGFATAQALRDAQPPAEFPPASYSGKQYVDSRGCVYVRAGIDGNVTWVPRVTRQRKLICGQTPTLGTAELAQTRQPTAPAPAATEINLPAGSVVATPAARPGQRASARVRAQPALPAEPAAAISPDMRVLPRHIYDARVTARGISVPKGYRPVWQDGRLNPKRAERTLAPSVLRRAGNVPTGYRNVWQDGRLSLTRGVRTAQGDAQSDQLWTRTLPRELKSPPLTAKTIRAPFDARRGNSPFWDPGQGTEVTRLATRSAPAYATPKPAGKPAAKQPVTSRTSTGQRYVRLALYDTDAEARRVARRLGAGGQPIQVGLLRRGGREYRTVLAGPFASDRDAKAAIAALTKAGLIRRKGG